MLKEPAVRETHSMPRLSYEFDIESCWKSIPAWRAVSAEEFSDHQWQLRNSVSSLSGLAKVLGSRLSEGALEEFKRGMQTAPMNMRLTPYLVSLIDWDHPESDPLRRQFIPMASQLLADHPMHQEDSLGEDEDRVAPFLTHRYHDKALFLPTTICPVYCSYCTRSRVVGGSTPVRDKATYGAKQTAWEETFAYIRSHPELEDIVISGGDASMLRPDQLEEIGLTLLGIPHVRRIRIATKGLAILPMQVTSDDGWVKALERVTDFGRKAFKEVCLHTHFGTTREMSQWTVEAMKRLVGIGIKVRNQSVLLRGVNDTFGSMYRLVKSLSWLTIQPYYVYTHDMVPGCEHLRTTIATTEELSKALLGTTAGFNLPRFVCDAPGGGGKREISSYEYYDAQKGISAWTAPRIKPGRVFYYYDPIDELPSEGQAFWRNVEANGAVLEDERSRIEAKYRSLSPA